MTRVLRYDVGELKKPKRLPNGWLRVEAYLTRTGVFEYRNPDGTKRRELRLDEEVFSPSSLETFASVPFTNEHPAKEGRRVMLDAENTSEFARGSVESVRRDGDKLAATIMVTDQRTIADLEAGKVQVSVGYDADLEWKAGEHQGERYDAIQRGIVANHVALVKRGRAGPESSVRLDEADTAMVFLLADSGSAVPTEERMFKMKFDEAELEVSEEVAKAIGAERNATAAKLASVQAEVEKVTARADAADAEIAKLKVEVAEAPAKAKAAAEARATLESKAAKLAPTAKFDGLSDLEVMRSATEGHTGRKLEGKSEAYVQAAFDIALERLDEEKSEPRSANLNARTDSAEQNDALAQLAELSKIKLK